MYICMGELQSYYNISPIFKLPRSQEIFHIFPRSAQETLPRFSRAQPPGRQVCMFKNAVKADGINEVKSQVAIFSKFQEHPTSH